jgi:hypothetical protein
MVFAEHKEFTFALKHHGVLRSAQTAATEIYQFSVLDPQDRKSAGERK